MKKCMICMVLLCLALAACTAVTRSPTSTTTEPQMNGTTAVPTTVFQPDITTTVPSTSGPIISSSQLTAPPSVEKVYPCVYRDDGNCIFPIGGPLVHKVYWEDKSSWATAIYPPFSFKNYQERQIPAIQLVGPLYLDLAENMELTHLEVQTQKDVDGTASTLQALSDLAPGAYYIRMVIIQTGKYVAGDYETSTYIYGFKLIVPVGYVEQKADLTGVELTAGSQTVIPIKKMRDAYTYDESKDRWLCGLGSGVKFGSIEEEDIPVLTLVTAIRISIPENASFTGIYIQSERTGQSEQTSLAEMAELAPGTYYVKIGLTHYGDTYKGNRETYYYEYGFKLVKPAA